MVDGLTSPAGVVSLLGIALGLGLLARGLGGQRRAARIGDTATSTISAIAVGEVRVSGTVEPAELTLTSALQSRECVYYHSRVDENERSPGTPDLDEERAVGFRVRDPSGSVRIFPRGARWLVPEAFDERAGMMGEPPPGLWIRDGGAIRPTFLDRESQIAQLLTVRVRSDGFEDRDRPAFSMPDLGELGRRGPHYREARIEPGDTVTVVGMALPFDQLLDPSGADAVSGSGIDASGGVGDPEVAADLAEARAAGILEADPAEAWGNAAIAGFGIGRPVRAPELDPGARQLPIASTVDAERAERTFTIAPEELVIAATPEVDLLVSLGAPAAGVAREQTRFLVGLLGAVLAIGSAVALAATLSGGLPS